MDSPFNTKKGTNILFFLNSLCRNLTNKRNYV